MNCGNEKAFLVIIKKVCKTKSLFYLLMELFIKKYSSKLNTIGYRFEITFFHTTNQSTFNFNINRTFPQPLTIFILD